jgi:hypothetical protein
MPEALLTQEVEDTLKTAQSEIHGNEFLKKSFVKICLGYIIRCVAGFLNL